MAKAGRVVGAVRSATSGFVVLTSGLRGLVPHRPAVTSVAGLLSEAGREHGWPPAEDAGSEHPRPIHRVLDRSVWDVAAVRADRRARAHRGGRRPGPTAGRPRRGRGPLLDRPASPDDPGAARPRCSGPRRGKRGSQLPTPRTTPCPQQRAGP